MKFWGILIAILLLSGCGASQKPSSGAKEAVEMLPAHSGTEGAVPAEKAKELKGTVLERINADRYSYLRLSTASGEIWAAVFQTGVEVGAEVTIVGPMPMDGFESKTLNRKFDHIVFGTLKQESEESSSLMALHNAHSGASQSADDKTIKVDKASGVAGYTIGEIFVQKSKLKDKAVEVRGKVVKVNPDIMGKTWIHLRDGTGDAEARTNDLTITTGDSAAVGDIVLVKGTVRTDINLGMGYIFSVMIDNATVVKQ